MFGQLLMHSCGWGWVGILLLYFQTVDLCAGEQAGNGKRASWRIWALLPLSPQRPRVNPERLTIERRTEGIMEGGGGGGEEHGGEENETLQAHKREKQT